MVICCSIGRNHPAVLLSDLLVPPVNRIDRVGVDELKGHGIVAGVFQIVLLTVKTGRVAEVAREVNPVLSFRLDLEYQALPQSSLAQILSPLTSEQIGGRPSFPPVRFQTVILSARPICEVVLVNSLPSFDSLSRMVATSAPSFFCLDIDLMLIDFPQLDLIKCRIAGYGRVVAVAASP